MVDIKNCSLNIEFQNFLLYRLTELEKDEDNISYVDMWLQLNVIVSLSYNIFGNSDKKTTKRLLDLNKKVLLLFIIS